MPSHKTTRKNSGSRQKQKEHSSNRAVQEGAAVRPPSSSSSKPARNAHSKPKPQSKWKRLNKESKELLELIVRVFQSRTNSLGPVIDKMYHQLTQKPPEWHNKVTETLGHQKHSGHSISLWGMLENLLQEFAEDHSLPCEDWIDDLPFVFLSTSASMVYKAKHNETLWTQGWKYLLAVTQTFNLQSLVISIREVADNAQDYLLKALQSTREELVSNRIPRGIPEFVSPCLKFLCSLIVSYHECRKLPDIAHASEDMPQRDQTLQYRLAILSVQLFWECLKFGSHQAENKDVERVRHLLEIDPKFRKLYLDRFCSTFDELHAGNKQELLYTDMSVQPSIDELASISTFKVPPLLTNAEKRELTPRDAMLAHLDRQFRLLRQDCFANVFARAKDKKRLFLEKQQLHLSKLDPPQNREKGIVLEFDLVLQGEQSRELKDIALSKRALCESSVGEFKSSVASFIGIILDVKEPGQRTQSANAKQTWKLIVEASNDLYNVEQCLLAFKSRFEGVKGVPKSGKLPQSIPFSFRCASKSFTFALQPVARSLQMQASTLNPMDPICRAFFHDIKPECPQQVLEAPLRLVLDQSQARAYISSMVSPISLIQGPPGTGKTYVGAAIAASLIDQQHRVLCVCVTNHAVDQFTEEIIHAQESMDSTPLKPVRIGSKCDSDLVQKFSLKSLIANTQIKRLPYADHLEFQKKIEHTKNALVKAQNHAIDLMNDCQHIFKGFSLDLQGDSNFFSQFQNHLSCNIWNIAKIQKWAKNWSDWLIPFEYSDEELPFQTTFSMHDEDGFQFGAGRKQPKPSDWWRDWLKGSTDASKWKAAGVKAGKLWKKDKLEREGLYAKWSEVTLQQFSSRFKDILLHMTQLRECEEEIRAEQDAQRLLENHKANLIACTTSGAANQLRLISNLKPTILIVEEAGEVLEAHVLACLCPSITKVILIGDHKQLRPKIDNHQFSVRSKKGIDFNVSLFERLVNSNFDFATLQCQHRMKPSLSQIMKQCTYSDLQDHQSTQQLEDRKIPGLECTMSFWHCQNEEKSRLTNKNHASNSPDDSAMSSCSNQEEAKRAVFLANYILQQPEKVSIAVLTPYLGQLRLIRQEACNAPLLSKSIKTGDRDEEALLEEDVDQDPKNSTSLPNQHSQGSVQVKLATIDNFQGEEADIIIVSLVRSNKGEDGKTPAIGFLDEDERINVLFSRARFGFIVIGNYNTFFNSTKRRKKLNFWARITDFGFNLSPYLRTKCPRHPDIIQKISNAGDLKAMCPNGGCKQLCHQNLKCGHNCTKECHVVVHNNSTCVCTAIDSILCSVCEKEIVRPCREIQKMKEHGMAVICKVCEARKKMDKDMKELSLKKKRKQEEYAANQIRLDSELAKKQADHLDKMLEIESLESQAAALECISELDKHDADAEEYKQKFLDTQKEIKTKKQQLEMTKMDLEKDFAERSNKLEEQAREIDQQFENATKDLENGHKKKLDTLRHQEARHRRIQCEKNEALKAMEQELEIEYAEAKGGQALIECCICYDEQPTMHCIVCEDGHACCSSCYSQALRDSSHMFSCAIENEVPRVSFQCLHCKMALSYRYVLDLLDEAGYSTVEQMQSNFLKFLEAQHSEERIKKLRKTWEESSQADRAVREIENDILNTRCPSCHKVFLYTEGCLAFKCTNQSCHSPHFCGICLKHVAKDSPDCHHHVDVCSMPKEVCAEYPGSPRRVDMFATMPQFEEWHSYRKAYLLKRYFRGANLSLDIKKAVFDQLKEREMLVDVPHFENIE